MNTTSMDLFEILKYTLPSIIVFLTAFFIIRSYTNSENRKMQTNLLLKNKDIITPLRLQAYERVVLFLERISPESLLMRVNKQGMTAYQLQTELLASIRAEYEHNLSQQLYLSPKSWEMVKKAKASLIKLINTSATKIESKAPAIKLSQIILETIIDIKKAPTQEAIEFIKSEIQLLF